METITQRIKEQAMNEQEILEETGDDLGRALGEVLLNECTGHDFGDSKICGRCYQGLRWSPEIEGQPCPCKNFLRSTPDNAFKWRDWARDKFGDANYRDALIEIVRHETEDAGIFPDDPEQQIQYSMFLVAVHGKPEYYLKAAALCQIRSKK